MKAKLSRKFVLKGGTGFGQITLGLDEAENPR